jgi:hypothetical protein
MIVLATIEDPAVIEPHRPWLAHDSVRETLEGDGVGCLPPPPRPSPER